MRVTLVLFAAAVALGLWAALGGALETRTGRSAGTGGDGSPANVQPRADPAAPGALASDQAELALLRARVAQLEEVVAELQRRVAAGAASAPASAQAASAPAASDEEGAPPVAVDLAGEWARQPASSRPPPRADELASRLTALLPADAKLDRLECRGELCRVETTHRGMLRYREFLSAAFANPKTRVWSGALQFEQLSDPGQQDPEQDDVAVVAYLGPPSSQPVKPESEN